MKSFLITATLLVLAPLSHQAVIYANPKPEPITPKVTRITPEKLTGKPGKLLVIDASKAASDVLWLHDDKLADVLVEGKRLVIVMPAETKDTQTFAVAMFSKDPFVLEHVTITLPGTDDPTPDDKTTPVSKLSVQVAALTKAVNDGFAAQAKSLSDLDARVKALEGAKPPPVPVPVDAFQKAVQDAYIADGKPAAKIAQLASLYKLSGSIVNDKALTKTGQITAKMHDAAKNLFQEKDDSMPYLTNVRRVLGAEFASAIHDKTQDVLTDSLRVLIATEFSKAQKALEGVQP